MRRTIPAALAAGAAVAALGAAPAQAAATTTQLLGTYGFGRAQVIGEAGQAAGVWRSFTVRSGFAGDDLTVTYTPRTRSFTAEKLVYTAAVDAVADPQAECRAVGEHGVARKVWVSFRCRTGIVASYTLYVR